MPLMSRRSSLRQDQDIGLALVVEYEDAGPCSPEVLLAVQLARRCRQARSRSRRRRPTSKLAVSRAERVSARSAVPPAPRRPAMGVGESPRSVIQQPGVPRLLNAATGQPRCSAIACSFVVGVQRSRVGHAIEQFEVVVAVGVEVAPVQVEAQFGSERLAAVSFALTEAQRLARTLPVNAPSPISYCEHRSRVDAEIARCRPDLVQRGGRDDRHACAPWPGAPGSARASRGRSAARCASRYRSSPSCDETLRSLTPFMNLAPSVIRSAKPILPRRVPRPSRRRFR